MKSRPILLVTTLVFTGIAYAQSGGLKGMDMRGMKSEKKAQGTVHQGTGKLSKVDRSEGTVTIVHEPIASMAALGKLKSGDKVDLAFVQSGSDYVVTEIK